MTLKSTQHSRPCIIAIQHNEDSAPTEKIYNIHNVLTPGTYNEGGIKLRRNGESLILGPTERVTYLHAELHKSLHGVK